MEAHGLGITFNEIFLAERMESFRHEEVFPGYRVWPPSPGFSFWMLHVSEVLFHVFAERDNCERSEHFYDATSFSWGK
jgi:hypothetical protein